MAYTSIPASKREIGKPIDKDLIDNIHNNLEDLNERVSSISLSAGSVTLFNELIEAPRDFIPVGTIIYSTLPLPDFVAEIEDSGEWVLADGSSAAGSDWASLTGRSNLPDLRGRFLRAKDHGSGNNPSGDKALDEYTADSVASHDHNMSHNHSFSGTTSESGAHKHYVVNTQTPTDPTASVGPTGHITTAASYTSLPDLGYALSGSSAVPTHGLTSESSTHTHTFSGDTDAILANTGTAGGAETAPRYVTENAFIKINRGYISANTHQFVLRISQQVTINGILVSPVVQGVSGSFKVDIKWGDTPTTAAQSIFQTGQEPTLAYNASTGVTGLVDSLNNVVSAGQFVVVSVTATQGKLKKVHLYVSGDL